MYRRLATLARHSAAYGLGSIASKVLAIALLPLYVRYLTDPREYGIAEGVLFLDLFVVAVIKLGMQNAMMRFYYEHRDEGDAHGTEGTGMVAARIATTFMVVMATVGAAVLVVLARPAAELFLADGDLYRFIWVGAFGVWTSTVYQTLTSTLRLQQRPGTFVRFSLANVACSAAFTVLFVVALDMKAMGLLLGNFLGTAVLIPVVAAMQRRFLRPSLRRDLLGPMLRFSLPTTPMAVANQGLSLIDRWALAQLAGLTALGIYGIGSRMAQVVMLAVVALQMSWQPIAYSIKDDEEARQTYALVLAWFVALFGWLVAAAALLADPIVRVLTVPSYYGAAEIVPILALAAGVYGCYFIVGIGAGRVKRTGGHILVAMAALAVSATANLLLVPEGGLVEGEMGASIAALLANVALSVGMFIRGQMTFRVSYDWSRIVRAALLVVAAVGGSYLIPAGFDEPWWVVLRVALAMGFPLLLLALGFMPHDELAAARRALAARRDRGRSGRQSS